MYNKFWWKSIFYALKTRKVFMKAVVRILAFYTDIVIKLTSCH